MLDRRSHQIAILGFVAFALAVPAGGAWAQVGVEIGPAQIENTGDPQGRTEVEIGPAQIERGDTAALIAALEQRISALEAERDKPLVVKAPFTVVDAGGKPILTVAASGGGGILTMAGAGEVVLASDSAPRVEISNAGRQVTMGVGANQGVLVRSGDRVDALFGTTRSGSNPGLYVFGGGDKSVLFAGLSNSGRPTFSLRGASGGNDVAVLEASEDGNSGELKLFSGGELSAALRKSRDGAAGELELLAGGGARRVNVGAGTPAGLRVWKGNGGPPSLNATLAESGNPQLVLMSGSNLMASVEADDDKPDSGRLTLFGGGAEKVIVSGASPSGLRVFAGGDLPALTASVDDGGKPYVILSTDGNPMASLGSDKQTPASGSLELFRNGTLALQASADLEAGKTGVQVYGGADTPLIDLSVSDGEPSLAVGENGKGMVSVAVTPDGRPDVTLIGTGGPVATLAPLTSDPHQGALELYSDSAVSVRLGPSPEIKRPAVRVYNNGEMVFAAGVASNGGGAVGVIKDKTMVAGVEADAAGNGNVFVSSGKEIVASLNSIDDPGRGSVAIYSAGSAVARMSQGSHGGGNFTAGDPGGSGVFSAGYIPDGPGTACVAYKGTKCLGVGLTGLEGFH
jgi:hypothetical protein